MLLDTYYIDKESDRHNNHHRPRRLAIDRRLHKSVIFYNREIHKFVYNQLVA